MFEPAPGLKANLLESMNRVHSDQAGPLERGRLHFLLSWLHSILQERLRYVPLGWSKIYEFSDADHECAMNMIDNWLVKSALGRTNISPEKIPWDAIRSLLKESIYGGPLDSDFDQKVLDSFVDWLFSPSSFNLNFKLVRNNEELIIPEGTHISDFMSWIKKLPDKEPPAWLGLPENAEAQISAIRGNSFLFIFRKRDATKSSST